MAIRTTTREKDAVARLNRHLGSPAGATLALLSWYDRHARTLPWRVAPGSPEAPDTYQVWLSEIMLQQTTVATVKGYFAHFLDRWPAVQDLAASSLDDILHAWQGLGYYARARNLHKCAQVIVRDHGGQFPGDEDSLRALPGIGAYTAAAIAAIAFDQPAVVVDGNVERVVARLHAVEEPLPDARPVLKRLAAITTPMARAGDYAQAIMDLGATVCTPRAPACRTCPLTNACAARLRGIVGELPRKARKKARPTLVGVVWWIEDPEGRVMLRRRPESGLLGGMMEFPGSPWKEELPDGSAPVPIRDEHQVGIVTHAFTHFRLDLIVRAAQTTALPEEAVWADPKALHQYALPTVMKKVAQVVSQART
ncbi:MAG: A/G-specific adenine glycosylase [Rhodospirillaceae bacterium]|nr:A/G-specific adenine glycosylase [Rhodospirillaceae bacterium]